jgi:hypothetical protein
VSVCACDTIKEAEYLIVFHDNACEVCAVWGHCTTIPFNYPRGENPKPLTDKCW